MLHKFYALLRRHLIAGLALFLVLTGGTAVALDGSNTVFSDDIVNKEVRPVDLQSPVRRMDEDISATTVNLAFGGFKLAFWCHADATSAASILGSTTDTNARVDYSYIVGALAGWTARVTPS